MNFNTFCKRAGVTSERESFFQVANAPRSFTEWLEALAQFRGDKDKELSFTLHLTENWQRLAYGAILEDVKAFLDGCKRGLPVSTVLVWAFPTEHVTFDKDKNGLAISPRLFYVFKGVTFTDETMTGGPGRVKIGRIEFK